MMLLFMDTSISEQHVPAGSGALILLGPVLLVLLGLLPSVWLNRKAKLMAKLASGIALTSAVTVVPLLVQLLQGDTAYFKFSGLTVYLDPLAGVVFLLVSILLLVVMRFSQEYLAGDPQQGKYYKWLSLTGAAVLMLIISGNLLQFTLCWMSVSIFLHQLLVFYRQRPGALLAARKKFIVSRLGDLCLIGALVLVFKDFGTWDFRSIFGQIEAAHVLPGTGNNVWTALLLVLGALLKSAQFPFHSWLPDTMETPTPVSALMHAGIINAGGFLIMRFSPLIADVPLANQVLIVVGSFTALFGAFVMLTQASIKRGLAFSTVSQMGFMMLECGLGAYGMALLHLIAHSCYKAHAFLRSGSAVNNKFSLAPVVLSWASEISLALACLGVSALVYGIVANGFGSGSLAPEEMVLAGMLVVGVSFFFWNYWRQGTDAATVIAGLLGVAALCGFYHLLHGLFGGLVHGLPKVTGVVSWEVAILLIGCFFGGYLLCVGLFLRFSGNVLAQVYIHARNGFYINTLANRFIQRFWPVKL
jgi:NAD(P)H-quinone oxidoreductase subunit 5